MSLPHSISLLTTYGGKEVQNQFYRLPFFDDLDWGKFNRSKVFRRTADSYQVVRHYLLLLTNALSETYT